MRVQGYSVPPEVEARLVERMRVPLGEPIHAVIAAAITRSRDRGGPVCFIFNDAEVMVRSRSVTKTSLEDLIRADERAQVAAPPPEVAADAEGI